MIFCTRTEMVEDIGLVVNADNNFILCHNLLEIDR